MAEKTVDGESPASRVQGDIIITDEVKIVKTSNQIISSYGTGNATTLSLVEISGGGTLATPGVAGTLVEKDAVQTLTNKTSSGTSLTGTTQAEIINRTSGTLQLQTTTSGSVLINPADIIALAKKICAFSSGDISSTTTTQGIQFPTAAYKRKIVFFSSADNTHQFNGFGQETGLLLLQTHTTTEDVVAKSGTSSTTSQENFRIKGTGGIQVPTSGGTAATLDYWEETTHSTTFRDANGNASGSLTLQVSRKGTDISVLIPTFSFTTGAAPGAKLYSATVLLARWRPLNNVDCGDHTVENGGTVSSGGHVVVTSGGEIQIYKNAAEGNWDAVVSGGINRGICINYKYNL